MKGKFILKPSLLLLLMTLFIIACNQADKVNHDDTKARETLNTLLASLENKDIDVLKDVMEHSKEMELIYTSGNMTSTTAEFVNFHEEWFQDTSWTMSHEILNFHFHHSFATSTVKAYYKEANRDGSPYFHTMIVSYVLKELENGKWSIIKDQSTTFDKTKR